MTRTAQALAMLALAGAAFSTTAEARFGNQPIVTPGNMQPLFGNHMAPPPTNPPRFGNQTVTTPTNTQPLFGNQTNTTMNNTQPLFGNHSAPPPANPPRFGNQTSHW